MRKDGELIRQSVLEMGSCVKLGSLEGGKDNEVARGVPCIVCAEQGKAEGGKGKGCRDLASELNATRRCADT